MKTQPQAHTKGCLSIYEDHSNAEAIYSKISNQWTLAIKQGDSLHKIGGKTKEEAEANAQRIVKAVNMHDDLIKHLADAIERMDRAKGAIQRETGNGYGMLDTTELKVLLNKTQEGEVESPVSNPVNAEDKVYDLTYLRETMGHKKPLIKEIIEVFLKQCPLDLESLMDAILRRNYSEIREMSHRMKSSTSIMGMITATSLLDKIECLAKEESGIENIHGLNSKVNLIFLRAFKQLKAEKI